MTKLAQFMRRRLHKAGAKTTQQPASTLPKESLAGPGIARRLRNRLVRKGYAFYCWWLRGTWLGDQLARQVVKRGWVSPGEVVSASQVDRLSVAPTNVPILRYRLVQKGYAFYYSWLRGTWLGDQIAWQVVKRGWVSPTEVDVASRADQWSIQQYTQSLYSRLLQKAYAFYRRWLRGSWVGEFLARQIIKRGFVLSADGSELIVRSASLATGGVAEGDVAVPGFHLSPPLNIAVTEALTLQPQINILLPSLRLKHMSGGPNTALLLAAYLAESGESVRLIATDAALEGEESALYPYMDRLFQRPVCRERIGLVDGFNRREPVWIGADDLFVATAWWTAQMVKYAIQKTRHERFIYLIQDFEPILHEGSTFYARALETYGLPHIPLINTRLLLDHLTQERCGCYAEPAFVREALWFDPAIDRAHYFPETEAGPEVKARRRVLLFYARPTSARRNLFEMGLVALRQAVAAGVLEADSWEVWGMGEQFNPIPLGQGMVLNPLPWMDFEAYAKRVRTADLLLSLMLAPHPSYPPLEMAASGKLVVTNSYSVKTAERMQALSPNILVAAPSPENIAAVLKNAVGRLNAGLPSLDPAGVMAFPSSWDESLGKIIPRLKQQIEATRRAPSRQLQPISPGYPETPKSDYERFRKQRLIERRQTGPYRQQPGLLSFLTTVYDTDSRYLKELAGRVFLQDGGTHFEWVILDNGSCNEDTRAALKQLALHPCVRLERVEKNLGIIGGMRYCLERAQGRYVLPLDSDDLIEPDSVHVVTRFLNETGFPALLYTDEDKVVNGQFEVPYFKSAWDPVLFVHSCYIAHLCVIDREKALLLGLYDDSGAEGCHDWDSFIRFMRAGYQPVHIPEVLYSWRVHSQSTSGNITAKSYIARSHRHTLQKFLDGAKAAQIELIESPLFSYGVDWWFRRRRSNPVSLFSVLIGPEPLSAGMFAETTLKLDPAAGIKGLAALLEFHQAQLVHLCWAGVRPENDEWAWEAMGLLELFPDAVMVGGCLHEGSKVVDGPRFFGFGTGCDSPDRGRSLSDPGYFARLWKPHSVSACSSAHCVVRLDFLKAVLGELIQAEVSLNLLGPWLGALARENGKRVIYTPFLKASVSRVPEDGASQIDRTQFLSRFWLLLPDRCLLPSRSGLVPATGYALVEPARREEHLKGLHKETLTYADWLEAQLRCRTLRYPRPARQVTVSILTTIYERTNLALLESLADSILKQSLPVAQWVIVAHGPIPSQNLQQIRSWAQSRWGATLIEESNPLGIMKAMRLALDHAQGQYVVPVDADDLLTLDAVQILAHEIDRLKEPDLVYSDEDLLVADRPSSPYWRSVFDPILNLDSSYIWHLCAIKRESAMRYGLYTDVGATWCHDWDSVLCIANGGGRIEHVAEVLYHWRQHPESTTNKSGGDSRSLDSVRQVLERRIRQLPQPQYYSVAPWPVNRGAAELYIARSHGPQPRTVWIGDCQQDWPAGQVGAEVVVVAARADVIVKGADALNEVARLFELHPQLAAVGGNVCDFNDVVVDGCAVLNARGELESPWNGTPVNESGPYALKLKAQTVACTGAALGFFRLRTLKELGVPPLNPAEALSSWIAHACRKINQAGGAVAFSPLIQARTKKPVPSLWQPDPGVAGPEGIRPHAISRYGALAAYRDP